MSNLDEISRILGRIEANQATSKEVVDALFRRMDDLRADHSELIGVVKEHAAKLTFFEEELTDTVVPAIDEFAKLKQRGIGVIAVIGILSAGAGATLVKLSKLFTLTG